MHIHILGICGTFMGGIAAIAKSLGHHVTGSDANVYPPMSTQLEELGITLTQGFDPVQLNPEPDLVIIGNAMTRGNPAVEYVLERNINYISGPQWLSENVLKHRWVLAASGTHGKTSTSSMLAWILDYAGMKPGFLIGGIPENFGISARLGDSPFFVIEADEYDSAFFDKRSKFVHYHPRTLIMNNLEFDHADIFDSLKDIKKQFHHLLRILPSNGLVLTPADDENLEDVIDMGLWSNHQQLGKEWQIGERAKDGSQFEVILHGESLGSVTWSLIGNHNIANGIMAIAAARHAGIDPKVAMEALGKFVNVKRRMELRGDINNIRVYDDFAHHPSAILTTLEGLRSNVGNAKIIAILEPRSATMKQGTHKDTLATSWQMADEVFLFEPTGLQWEMSELTEKSIVPTHLHRDVDNIVTSVTAIAKPGDRIIVMSNGGFGGLHDKLLSALQEKHAH
ncbi:UDP-N-acetylmuramate:L-alanyl-gamma-D-glutamyl-meso-diaminopimelate ligase [Aestuariibacter sp. AA17]|uniref:UDP-N-acetylmuramate--L-alanyl-gamma-D-glutamyl-meso-2,6-diaminoheptandioate ligase n=1 Tax=Fluctibacter corallii TaxID=2984329 RepID=A0ABT3AC45_9ALTE|nr:UDP-N-acetylmuramate:L-alanyl-gamma-D-glutamyl-meso-diaminopimelate ligase [Aestuariibacter sp. AA17]MCV2886244.1 UDP-N-acetylmuramate:L-alanyl-gamma-D-glutamyl-meso-diaminopimelate ligase [Aestuariibacter sp. AA17]